MLRAVFTEGITFCVVEQGHASVTKCGNAAAVEDRTWFPCLAEALAEGEMCENCRQVLEEEVEHSAELQAEYEREIENG